MSNFNAKMHQIRLLLGLRLQIKDCRSGCNPAVEKKKEWRRAKKKAWVCTFFILSTGGRRLRWYYMKNLTVWIN